MIEIKNRWTCKLILTINTNNLRGADLEGANLRGADLYRADLYRANLRGANLEGANLREADLYRADLEGANLRGANLEGANLEGANLYRADLRGANLEGEILKQTPLTVANPHYRCLISDNYMRLGCKRFTHEEWANLTDEQIAEMDVHALEFWDQWKTPLLAMCKAHANKVTV